MLSAVAARKAKQQTAQPSSITAPTPEPASTTTPTPSPELSSKRKTSNQTPHPRKTKKTKHEKGPRYFADAVEDSFVQQDDLIIVDHDDSSSESGLELEVPTPAKPLVSNDPQAWSPSRPIPDSSDEESGIDDERPFSLFKTPRIPAVVDEHLELSTFKPNHHTNTFHLSPSELSPLRLPQSEDKTVLLIIGPSERLSLLGTYKLVVLHGQIEIAGVSLSPSKEVHHVFAPRCSPIPSIQCIPSFYPSSFSLPPQIHSELGEGSAVILLQELRTNIESLGQIVNIFSGVFEPSRWYKKQKQDITDLGIEGVRILTHHQRDVQPFVIPDSWKAALSTTYANSAIPSVEPISENQVYLIKGPKKVGKSTFARTLLNQLLTRYKKVAWLECDLGQSEFTPGGMVALNIISSPIFGPPFTHLTLPYCAHYVGSTTPRSSPSLYLAAIQACMTSYRLDIAFSGELEEDGEEVGLIPLVVSTMGWVKGLGADLGDRILEIVDPTSVFELHPQGYSQNHTDDSKRTYRIEGIPSSTLDTQFSGADWRVISMMSYFHAIFPPSPPSPFPPFRQQTVASWSTQLPLLAIPPIELECSKTLDKVFLVGAGMEDVVEAEIGRVLNGAIVALVSSEPDSSSDSDKSSKGGIPYTQGGNVVLPDVSKCLGLALIRSISPTSSHMQILTPIPPSLLAQCRILVKGELELPVWGMLDFREGDRVRGGSRGTGVDVPYLQWGRGGGVVGGERRKIRRNLMRRGQM